MALIRPIAGRRVDHAAQLLQLADRHEDEAGVVFAHLALVEIDDGEVVADGLGRLAGGGKGRASRRRRAMARNWSSPSACGKLAMAMPSTTPVCCSLAGSKTVLFRPCDVAAKGSARGRFRRGAARSGFSRFDTAARYAWILRPFRGDTASRPWPSASARAHRARLGGRGRRSRPRAARKLIVARRFCRMLQVLAEIAHAALASSRRCRSTAPAG